jgi:hypothetical protein
LKPPSGISRIFVSLILFQIITIVLVHSAVAGFLGQFSLITGEEYNDNIFFEENKEHDFITFFRPTFSLLYAPTGQIKPTFTANLIPEGQIFARHSDETNFGENVTFTTGYTYYHSPRLTIHASDWLRRRGATRTGEFGGPGDLPPTSLPPPGGAVAPPSSRRLGDFVGNGAELSNAFGLRGLFNYDPIISLVGDYGFGYTNFLDRGGNENSHHIGVRGVYQWKEEHNINFGYSVDIIKNRNGKYNVVHNIDGGDDYFSRVKIQLDPTLTISAVTGIAFNSGGDGPSIANRTNVTVTKLWEAASLNFGVNKRLTPSFGVAGISDTTSFFANFNISLTERLSAFVKGDYSLFDTKDVNFNTLVATTGLSYRFTRWLSSDFRYVHRWRDGGPGSASTDLETGSKITGNNVFLTFTVAFDIWPTFGLSR